MKKLISLATAAFMLAGCVTACNTNTAKGDNIQIVTTIFPEYDWVVNVLGENPANAEVTMLLDNGVDLHSYQPSVDDIVKISDCDLFIYVGGESDGWVDEALEGATNEDMVVINLMDVLSDAVVEEEEVEGMEHHHHDEEEGEEHDHEHEEGEEDHDHDHEHEEPEMDEHVWLSLDNAGIVVNEISDAMQQIDPDNADTYKSNAEAYVAKLDELDAQYQDAVANAATNTLVFGDRFPFRYMTDDYNLEYFAAFSGCSAETEASFDTITFLASKIDELSLNAIVTIEGENKSIAESIVENTATQDQQILTLDSMQATTSDDVANGATYLSIMQSNLEVLKTALG
ncbi:MAG: zinc ABC transporter substrate-binding protein [Saccharofermentans sp.]|nr:zinc ABC transporter substrate-binding protein [Saccharofermentans sp.]